MVEGRRISWTDAAAACFWNSFTLLIGISNPKNLTSCFATRDPTTASSKRLAKINVKIESIHTSKAFTYETRGKLLKEKFRWMFLGRNLPHDISKLECGRQQGVDAKHRSRGNHFLRNDETYPAVTIPIRQMDKLLKQPDKNGRIRRDIRLQDVPTISPREGEGHRQLVPYTFKKHYFLLEV